MAKTDIKKYTVQEKLNKMDLDVIEITTASITSDAAGELSILPTEIPNAVSVPGGSCLLQTCLVYNPSGSDLPLNIFISDIELAFTGGSTDDPAAIGSTVDGADLTTIASASAVARIMGGVQCVFNTGTGIDVGSADTISYVGSLGAPLKAAAGSTSLYLWAVGQATVDPDCAFTIKLGFVKD